MRDGRSSIGAKMEHRTLGKTAMSVSILGYGASPLGNEFGETDAEEGIRAVHCAIDLGINYFDVSPYYGRTLAEKRLGEALSGKRDSVYLATKCGRYGLDVESCDYSARRVTRSVDESLSRLKTDYVDLLQVHDIEFGHPDQIINETIPALRKIQQAGKARFIGITALPLKMLRHVASQAGIDTILSYCRYNLMVTDMDDILTPFCREHGIGLINASPLHMRILTEKGAPDWHPAPPEVIQAGRKVASLCADAGVSVSDVAMRFCLDHPYVATTLVGMSKQRHVEQNIRVLEFVNNAELLGRIEEIIRPVKDVTWYAGRSENTDSNWANGL